ncbi:WecB/TagA/CpsF family glycosyltransferase [Anaerosporobacter faecicola]|uniref:WecB/TagA/CpsF family glycosyltransferase n=1 Tax=Anaerosporobacter faecicola TaxID=2718714 RepID=UPI00143C4E24|nr:WecB/TagA/CpsF family glycosyltransferase [Anaerosporobacter faecicola]
MKNKINVMGVDLDAISVLAFSQKLKEFLLNDYLNIVFLITAKTLEYANEDEEFRNSLTCADYILPSQEMLLYLPCPHIYENSNYVSDFHKLQLSVRNMEGSKKTVFVISDMVNQVESFLNYKRKAEDRFIIAGSYMGDIVENEDLVVNEINATAPDILVLALESPQQELWIAHNYTKLNAKLCLVLADIKDGMLKEYNEIPKVVQKLGLQGIYHRLKAWKPWKQSNAKRIFKKKLENYNNK